MVSAEFPPCGFYRTIKPIGEVPAGRLVYFHNHGDPGPGIYLPVGWTGNRARFSDKGTSLSGPADAHALEPLRPEGFYAVEAAFHCCPKRCRQVQPDMLVQLGYDGAATPILFLPQRVDGGLSVPERGTTVDRETLEKLRLLKVPAQVAPGGAPGSTTVLH